MCECWSELLMPLPYSSMAMIEQRAVAVGRRFSFSSEVREQLDVIRVDLRGLCELHRIVLVVRDRVVRLGHAEPRIGAVGLLAAEHAA